MYDPTVPWWERELEDKEDLAKCLAETVRDVERRQSSIHQGNQRHARIYAGYLPSGLAMGTGAGSNLRQPFAATKALVRNVIDVAHSLITRNRPKSTFVTTGADFKIQMQAEDMDQFMIGAFHAGGIYQTAPRAAHDSMVFGTGGWKYVLRGTGEDFRVMYERVLTDDLIVDEEECREDCFVQPNIYHRRIVRTDSLVKKYGGDAKDTLAAKIDATKGNSGPWPGLSLPRDRSVLVEAIHVDPENPANNKLVEFVDGVVLRAVKWPYDFQPYTFLWWSLPITGFYGDGIAYRQYGRQERVTYMHRWITKVFDLFATPTAWVDPMGGPPTLHMSDDIGKVIMARKPPSFQTQQLIQAEVYQWLNKLEDDGYEDEGMNRQMMQGSVQPGLESAPAQREAVWREGQRFNPVSQRWENAIAVEAAYKTAAFYRHAAETGTTPNVRWADRKLLHTIDWPNLSDSHYLIRPEASSLDSLSPSARTQSALELAQTGWISPQEGRALVAHPDLKASDDLDNAPETYAKWVVHQLWRGVPLHPDEKSEMGTVFRVVREARLLSITKGVQESAPEILANQDRYLDELDVAMQAAAQAAQAKMMAEQAAAAPVPGMSEAAAGQMPAPSFQQ